MSKLLIINQALNENSINMYKLISKHYGKIQLITGSYNNSDDKLLNIIKAPSHNPANYFSRIESWIQYTLFVHKWMKSNRNKFNMILVYTNPPIIPIYLYLMFRKKPVIYSVIVWDIYPDIIEKSSMNFMFKPILLFWHYLNKKVYRNANTVVTLGKRMAKIVKKDVSNKDIAIIPNWSNPERIKPISKDENKFIVKNKLESKFIILYSGKIGLGHEIKTILNAAEDCKDKDIVFVFIGFGPGTKIIREFIDNNEKSNVKYYPFQEEKMFRYSIASGDIGVVSQISGMEELFMPCKTYDMMAAGMPIIGISSGDNDLKYTIDKYECGYNVNNGDYSSLLDKIMEIKNNTILRTKLSKNARKAIMEELNEKNLYKAYDKILKGMIK